MTILVKTAKSNPTRRVDEVQLKPSVKSAAASAMKDFSHWTRPLQSTRTGILLRPTAADADLIGVNLGMRPPRSELGHGVLLNDGDEIPLLAAHLDDLAG